MPLLLSDQMVRDTVPSLPGVVLSAGDGERVWTDCYCLSASLSSSCRSKPRRHGEADEAEEEDKEPDTESPTFGDWGRSP